MLTTTIPASFARLQAETSALESAGAITMASTPCAIISSTRATCRLRSRSSLIPLTISSYSLGVPPDALLAPSAIVAKNSFASDFMMRREPRLAATAPSTRGAGASGAASPSRRAPAAADPIAARRRRRRVVALSVASWPRALAGRGAGWRAGPGPRAPAASDRGGGPGTAASPADVSSNRVAPSVSTVTVPGRREVEVAAVGEDRIEDAGQVPGRPVVRRRVAADVRLGHRVMRHVAVVALDADGRVRQRDPDLEPAEDHRRRPAIGERPGARDVLDDVVFAVLLVAVDRREGAGHEREQLDLAVGPAPGPSAANARRRASRAAGPGSSRSRPGRSPRTRPAGRPGPCGGPRSRPAPTGPSRSWRVTDAGRASFSSASERNPLCSTTPPLPDDADRDVAAAVERVDGVHERGGQLVVDADRHREQPA